jgi:riboflavin synthase
VFTGIIEDVGIVKDIKSKSQGIRVSFYSEKILEDVKLGDSIAVNGVCLTAIDIKGNIFSVDVSFETVSKSNIGRLRIGDRVNLERALKVSDRLDGHIVLGHVDGVGNVLSIERRGEFYILRISISDYVSNHCVDKGSVSIDGISLTISRLEGTSLEVAVIPHTFNNTNLMHKKTGETVNIEVDILGKYVEKMLKKGTIDERFLAENGFV